MHIIGGGLAGAEAAWQAAAAGASVVLYEMRPARMTPAHTTGLLAELVCSNSLKSDQPGTAAWLLKEELRRLGSLLIGAAGETRVPGGHALTVDRTAFARRVTATLEGHPRITIRRETVRSIIEAKSVVVASGPLTGEELAADIQRRTGRDGLYFYDAISPIVEAESIDLSVAFRGSRYGRSGDPAGDYLNCPLSREQYAEFLEALRGAERHAPKIDADVPYFEACLPVEELARRGPDTLRFGPMKPVGLTDPRTGRRPYAVVQLRQEDLRAGSYNLVGFQTSLRYPEQERVFRMIPGLERAVFLRFGQMHRNTYINAPALLTETLEMRESPGVFFAGQISGVEGYVEAIATGLVAGRNAAAALGFGQPFSPPRQTAIGSLCRYVSGADPGGYQPANMTFDLLPPLEEATRQRLRHDKRARHLELCNRALAALQEYRNG